MAKTEVAGSGRVAKRDRESDLPCSSSKQTDITDITTIGGGSGDLIEFWLLLQYCSEQNNFSNIDGSSHCHHRFTPAYEIPQHTLACFQVIIPY